MAEWFHVREMAGLPRDCPPIPCVLRLWRGFALTDDEADFRCPCGCGTIMTIGVQEFGVTVDKGLVSVEAEIANPVCGARFRVDAGMVVWIFDPR